VAFIVKNKKAPHREVECNRCGSIIGYYEEDINRYSGRDISGGPDGREWVNCPKNNCSGEGVIRSW
jgi:hypothetical protein